MQEGIGRACARAGRDPTEVRLVAVTKTAGADAALELVRLGVPDLGESRAGELVRKRAALAGEPAVWHMLGHVQRNKARAVVESADWVHSVDSARLLEALGAEAARRARGRLRVLLQVNVSGESTKGGFAPQDARAALELAAALPALDVRGLMTMAPAEPDPERARPVFRHLRELRDELRSQGYLCGPELSMGMSDDHEVAVEEGSTMVRVGRRLFEGGPDAVRESA